MNEDIQTAAENYLNNKNLPEVINTFPSLILNKSRILSDLETKIGEAKEKAKKAEEAANTIKGYEQKKVLFFFKRKSGNNKEIIEGTQDIVKLQAEATRLNTEALDLTFEFQNELTKTMEFLFYLGCYNIATNESMIASLNDQLNKEYISDGNKNVKLSTNVKEQFKNVVSRLMKQRDVLARQEQLRKKSKGHGQAIARNQEQINALEEKIKQKEEIEEKQSALMHDLESSIAKKDKIDEEQSRKIEELIGLLKEKDLLDMQQSEKIDEIATLTKSFLEDFRVYKKKRNIIICLLSIISVMGFVLSLFSFIM